MQGSFKGAGDTCVSGGILQVRVTGGDKNAHAPVKRFLTDHASSRLGSHRENPRAKSLYRAGSPPGPAPPLPARLRAANSALRLVRTRVHTHRFAAPPGAVTARTCVAGGRMHLPEEHHSLIVFGFIWKQHVTPVPAREAVRT